MPSAALFNSYGGNEFGFGAQLRPSWTSNTGTSFSEMTRRLMTDIERAQILPGVRMTVHAQADESRESRATSNFMSGSELRNTAALCASVVKANGSKGSGGLVPRATARDESLQQQQQQQQQQRKRKRRQQPRQPRQ